MRKGDEGMTKWKSYSIPIHFVKGDTNRELKIFKRDWVLFVEWNILRSPWLDHSGFNHIFTIWISYSSWIPVRFFFISRLTHGSRNTLDLLWRKYSCEYSFSLKRGCFTGARKWRKGLRRRINVTSSQIVRLNQIQVNFSILRDTLSIFSITWNHSEGKSKPGWSISTWLHPARNLTRGQAIWCRITPPVTLSIVSWLFNGWRRRGCGRRITISVFLKRLKLGAKLSECTHTWTGVIEVGKEESLTKDFSLLSTTLGSHSVSFSFTPGFEYFLLFWWDLKYSITLTMTIIPKSANTRSEYMKVWPGNRRRYHFWKGSFFFSPSNTFIHKYPPLEAEPEDDKPLRPLFETLGKFTIILLLHPHEDHSLTANSTQRGIESQ